MHDSAQSEEVEDMWNKIKNGINEVAVKIMGNEERSQRSSWFDEECRIMLEDKKRAYNKMMIRNARQNEEEYKDKRRRSRRRR
jgi:hypothetical protein